MTIGLGAGKAGAFKTLALWLGLIALMIQALAPLCMAAPAASGGGNTIVICTAHGFETVTIGADGKPIQGTPDTGHHNIDCPLCGTCLMGGGFTTPSAIALPAPSLSVAAAQTIAAAPAASRPQHFSYLGRAPPRIAKTQLA